MKAIINYAPVLRDINDTHHIYGILIDEVDRNEVIRRLNKGFINILFLIASAQTESDLRHSFMSFLSPNITKYYTWGFGAHHMWVKQIDGEGNVFDENILKVEF